MDDLPYVSDMEQIKLRWAHAKTHRERAEIEQRIYELAPKDVRRKGCARWASSVLSIPINSAEKRTELRLAGSLAEPLWERIDGPEMMVLEAASRLLARARLRAIAEGVQEPEAMRRELAEYDTWLLVKTDNGTFRKRPQRPRGMGHRSPGGGASRERWAAVRAAIRRVVDVELSDVASAHARGNLRAQLESEVSTLVDLFMSRIRAARRTSSLDDTPVAGVLPDRKAIRDACQLLSVDAPAAGESIGHITYAQAKKNFRRLAMEYHPDRNSNEGTVERYQAVVEAMQIIESSYQQKDSDNG